MDLTPRQFDSLPILEGIVTTRNEDGSTQVAPMGPRVDWPVTRLLLRPFKTSSTYKNLARERRGIMHVTDDTLLIARAAVNRLATPLPLSPGPEGYGERLRTCAAWYAFNITAIDDSSERSEMVGAVAESDHPRPFFGFNRAKHAVIEAAILATRLPILKIDRVLDEFSRLATIVEKTAGPDERLAFAELQQFVTEQLGKLDTKTMLDS